MRSSTEKEPDRIERKENPDKEPVCLNYEKGRALRPAEGGRKSLAKGKDLLTR